MDKRDATFNAVFKIGNKTGDADSVIKLRGDMNVLALPRLGGALDYALAGHPARVIVDLADVDTVDISGLSFLVAARSRAAEMATPLLIKAPNAHTAELLAATGLDRVLPVVPDRAFPPKRTIHAARQERATSVGETARSFDIVSVPGAPDCIVAVRGDLDLRILAGLRLALREVIAARPVMLIVDLAKVTSIDASGLAVLAAARRRGLKGGTRLLLRAPTASTVDLLAKTGLDRVLPIVPEVQRVGRPGHRSIGAHGDRPRRPFLSR
jgi:anti-anti-sigma factor